MNMWNFPIQNGLKMEDIEILGEVIRVENKSAFKQKIKRKGMYFMTCTKCGSSNVNVQMVSESQLKINIIVFCIGCLLVGGGDHYYGYA